MKFEQQLREAEAEQIFVRVEQEDPEGEFVGVVLGFSETLVSLAILDDRVRMGGMDVILRSAITDIELPAPHADFYETTLRLRGEVKPENPGLDLTSVRSALESISKIAPLVVIHRELLEPDVCEIGQVAEFEAKAFQLREIDPDADWQDEVSTYRYEDITRMGFGGDYEAALALVAGLLS